MNIEEKISVSISDVANEVTRAKKIHSGEFNSLHEGYGVLLEEMDELWDEIKAKKPDPVKVRTEAMQVAAMAVRIMAELS